MHASAWISLGGCVASANPNLHLDSLPVCLDAPRHRDASPGPSDIRTAAKSTGCPALHDYKTNGGLPKTMAAYADGSDGTDVNAVCRSRDEGLVIVADDSGHVRLFNAPVACRFAAHRAYLGHSSHCLGVGFLASQTMAASCGGRDAAVLLWKVIDGGDEAVDGEYIERPPAARPAWHEGCDITSTTDILRRARPLA